MNGHRRNRDKCLGLITNVRSFVKNCSALTLELSIHNFDLVVLTETWLNSQNELKALMGTASNLYIGVRCERHSRKGGGILLLLKRSLSYNEVFSESVESCYEILICDVKQDDESFRVICVYRTPDCSASGSHQLAKAISDFSAINYTTLLLGDFNLPDLSSSSTGYTSKCFSEIFETHGFQQLVLAPTRRSSVLDLILCNKSGFVSNVQIGPPVGSSDHASVTFQLDLKRKSKEIRWVRDYRCADYYQIGTYLAGIDWVGMMNSGGTVNQLYETLLAVLHHTIQLYVPLRKLNAEEKGLPEHLRRLSRRRLNCWKKASATGSQQDWSLYESLSCKLGKALHRYNLYLERRITLSRDKKAFYKFMSSHSGKDNAIPNLLGSNGEFISTDKDKADLMAEAFQKVYNRNQIEGDSTLVNDINELPRPPNELYSMVP